MGFFDSVFSSMTLGLVTKPISFLHSEDVEGARKMLAEYGIKSSSKTMNFDGEYGITVSAADYNRAIELVNRFNRK